MKIIKNGIEVIFENEQEVNSFLNNFLKQDTKTEKPFVNTATNIEKPKSSITQPDDDLIIRVGNYLLKKYSHTEDLVKIASKEVKAVFDRKLNMSQTELVKKYLIANGIKPDRFIVRGNRHKNLQKSYNAGHVKKLGDALYEQYKNNYDKIYVSSNFAKHILGWSSIGGQTSNAVKEYLIKEKGISPERFRNRRCKLLEVNNNLRQPEPITHRRRKRECSKYNNFMRERMKEYIKMGIAMDKVFMMSVQDWRKLKNTIPEIKQSENIILTLAQKYKLKEQDVFSVFNSLKIVEKLSYKDFEVIGLKETRWNEFMYDTLVNVKDIEKIVELSTITFSDGFIQLKKQELPIKT